MALGGAHCARVAQDEGVDDESEPRETLDNGLPLANAVAPLVAWPPQQVEHLVSIRTQLDDVGDRGGGCQR